MKLKVKYTRGKDIITYSEFVGSEFYIFEHQHNIEIGTANEKLMYHKENKIDLELENEAD